MIVKKIDEYRDKYINNSETTIGVYELRNTKDEKHITLLPGEEKILKVKEKPKEVKKEKIENVLDTKKIKDAINTNKVNY